MKFQLPMPQGVTALIDIRRDATDHAKAIADLAKTTAKSGALGVAVYISPDDDKVLTYAQWPDRQAAQAWLDGQGVDLVRIGRSDRWSARLFRLASTANKGPLSLDGPDAEIAHTGLFAMLDAAQIDIMLELARDAAETAVAQTPELLTANFHASFDNERVVNLGFWSEEAAFRRLAANPPFQNRYWSGLAENEPGFYRRFFVA